MPGRGGSRVAVWTALAAAAVIVGACARPGQPASITSTPRPAESAANTVGKTGAQTDVGTDATRPARDGPPGLELWVWLVSDERVPIEVVSATPREARSNPGITEAAGAAAADPLSPDKPHDKPPTDPPPPAMPMLVQDTRADLDALLSAFAERPVPMPAETRDRWARGGLAVYAVPRGELDTIEFQARLTGVVQRQWLGVLPLWTDVASGARLEEATALVAGSGEERVPRGRPRLLVRAWPTPMDDGDRLGAALHVEIVPQVRVSGVRPRGLDLRDTRPEGPGLEHQGPLIQSLAASLRLREGEAIVLVPTRGERTVGAAVLEGRTSDDGPLVRQVLVLIAHVPDRVRLLP